MFLRLVAPWKLSQELPFGDSAWPRTIIKHKFAWVSCDHVQIVGFEPPIHRISYRSCERLPTCAESFGRNVSIISVVKTGVNGKVIAPESRGWQTIQAAPDMISV